MEQEIAQISRSNNSVNVENEHVNVSERDETSASSNINLGYKLKPDTFDGTGSLREFFTQFELIARANRWTNELKTVALASSLRGKARSVLDCIKEIEKLEFAELKSKLELRFGEGHLSGTYYTQFTNRRQKFGKEIVTLGGDIERLAPLAYPECAEEIREKIACAQFVNAINDGFIKRTLQLEGVSSLKMAIERAMTIKVINENSFSKKKEFDNNNDSKRNSNFYNNKNKNSRDEIHNKEKEQGKTNKGNNNKREFDKKSQIECWQCGTYGHYRSECPKISEGKKEN